MRHLARAGRRLLPRAAATLLPLGLAATLALPGSARAADRQAVSPTAVSAATPPMGWNDWAHYECAIDERLILDQAEALVSTGLAARGYRTVTIDDCWPARSRDAAGDLVADPVKFPDGMAYVAQRVHALGLRFGIYEDAGTTTCGGYPGSWDHWRQDADTFASWGVDYLKLDGCNVPAMAGQTEEQTYRAAYADMSRALAATGRPIVFSESAPAYFQHTPDWYRVLGWVGHYGQLWREGADIRVFSPTRPDLSRWSSVLTNYGYNSGLARYAKPGNWNDPDFLIAGDPGLTLAESRSQVALWAMMAAPLNLSVDVTKLSPAALAVLGDRAVIAVDQDPLGRQGGVVAQSGGIDVLVRPLAGGDRAVALLNRGTAAATASTTAADIGFLALAGCSYRVEDLWTGASTTTSGVLGASVPSHDTAIFRVHPESGCAAARPTGQITTVGGTCLGVPEPPALSEPPELSEPPASSGAVLGTAACDAGTGQRWAVPGDGTVRALGACLAATGESGAAAAVLEGCDGGATQQWTYRRDGELVAASGDCLGAGADNSGPVVLAACGDHAAGQVWALPT